MAAQGLLVHRLAETADGLAADHILRAANEFLRHMKALESLWQTRGAAEKFRPRLSSGL